MTNNSKSTTPPQNLRTYLISSAQLTEIMRYLMTRPYGEVVKHMNMLATLNQLDKNIGADFVKQQAVDTNAKKWYQ